MANVTIAELVTDEVAVVEVSTELNGKTVSAKGWSKKHPKDHPDPKLGRTLALARALQELSTEVDKRAQEMIERPLKSVAFSWQGLFPGEEVVRPNFNIDFTLENPIWRV